MTVTLNHYQNLLDKVQKIVQKTEQDIVQSVNRQKVEMCWEIGKIIDEHLVKNNRADYGKKLFHDLAKDILINERVLYQMRSFYKAYPTLPKSENGLKWSHYRNLVSVKNEEKRKYLEDLTATEKLGVKSLQREIAKSKPRAKKIYAGEKLKVTRGKVFTYKLVTKILKQVQDDVKVGRELVSLLRHPEPVSLLRHPELVSGSQKGPRVKTETLIDCGFKIFTEVKTSLKTDGEIVESVKKSEGFGLKKSSVDSKKIYTYKAILDRVVDGDTIHVTLDLGFKIRHQEILRLAKINAAESTTAAGKKATKVLQEILKDAPFLIIKTNKTDIYGRYIADVFFGKKDETNAQKVADSGTYLNQLLLERGVVELY